MGPVTVVTFHHTGLKKKKKNPRSRPWGNAQAAHADVTVTLDTAIE